MRHFLLSLVLFSSALPLAHGQAGLAGFGMHNVVIWPQPDLTVPIRNYDPPKLDPDLDAGTKHNVAANARTLASMFPAAQRAQMERAYKQSMDVYVKLEDKLDRFPNDLSASLAAFIVGNYMVLNDSEVSDEAFKAVASQLYQQPKMSTAFKTMKQGARRDLYEQTAMVGTFMALAWKSRAQTPQPPNVVANMREAARQNLELLLRRDPAGLRITEKGMRYQ